jgi:hypothetical protein
VQIVSRPPSTLFSRPSASQRTDPANGKHIVVVSVFRNGLF